MSKEPFPFEMVGVWMVLTVAEKKHILKLTSGVLELYFIPVACKLL